MKLHILHDSRSFERYSPLIEEMHRQGIDYQLWDIVECQASVIKSINLSHKRIVQYAKDNKLPEICIGEDDVYFPSPKGWMYFIMNKPKEFDLYLSSTFAPKGSGLVCGLHCYVISEKFYDKFLAAPENEHIDTAMDSLGGDYKFCYPYAALQREGIWSANNKSKVNYTALIKNKEDIYQ